MGIRALFLVNDRTYFSVYQACKKEYGLNETENIWRAAGILYEELLSACEEDDHALRQEIGGQLLKGIAIYKSIKEKHPDQALKLMEDGLRSYAKDQHKKLKKRLKWKISKRLFVIAHTLKWSQLRSLDRGYVRDEVVHDKKWKKMKVLVQGCPYRTWCRTEGVPELCSIFCEYETMLYKNIPGLIYHQSQELEIDNSVKACEIYMGLYQAIGGEEEKRKKKTEKWKKTFFFI